MSGVSRHMGGWSRAPLLVGVPRQEPGLWTGPGPVLAVGSSGPVVWPLGHGPSCRALLGQVGGLEAGSPKMHVPGDPLVYHSWIIGAAVVNAFYSPNRNQIGTVTPSPPVPKLSLQWAVPAPPPGGTPSLFPPVGTSPRLCVWWASPSPVSEAWGSSTGRWRQPARGPGPAPPSPALWALSPVTRGVSPPLPPGLWDYMAGPLEVPAHRRCHG